MPIDPLVQNIQSPPVMNDVLSTGLIYSRRIKSETDTTPREDQPFTGVDSATFHVVDPVQNKRLDIGVATIVRNGEDNFIAVDVSLTAEQTAKFWDYCGAPQGSNGQPVSSKIHMQVTLYDDEGNGYLYVTINPRLNSWA